MNKSEIQKRKEKIERIKKKYIPKKESYKPNQNAKFQFHSKLKEYIWIEINNFITQIREDFDEDCRSFNDDTKFEVLSYIILKYLDQSNLINKEWSSKIIIQIQRSIVMIYLLSSINAITKKPYSDRGISRMAGYTRVPSYLNEIKKCLGVKKNTKTTQIWTEIDAHIAQIRKIFDKRYEYREENEKFDLLKKEVMNFLIQDTNLLSVFVNPKIRTDIESSIVIIYLLRSIVMPIQDEIVKKSGADARKIRNIEHYFGISRTTKNDPLNLTKICIRCNKNLSYNKFRKKQERVESVCRDCQGLEDAIKRFQNKVVAANFVLLKEQGEIRDVNKFLTELYQDKKFNVDIKCPKCGLDLNSLPALQFHHPDENLKTISWGEISDYGIDRIITYLDEEECVLMCGNCHMNEKAKFLIEHLSEISNSENIHWSLYNNNEKRNLRRAIKKKKVIEDLYEGCCVYCKTSIYSEDGLLNRFLAAIDFHHTIKELKKHTWSKDLRDKENIIWIKKILLKEKQVASCKNCHFILKAKYFNDNTKYEIFSKYLSDKVLKKLDY